ncbi:glyoxalase [Mesorhizobium sp. Root554]|uniref:VOC family protein n=1 Tax=unclassified Mesorhizobium TaxID=325217 RepID=UPI0006FF30E3|nr:MULTISPECIES: VOC family protein [unclassified Mesorhizobium]KQZ14096.1 glyoxalase [Mesorhizobium sp. Root1471]KQZ36608.1 glyoxalase [Mesorhizobium sp. Root554]
MPKTPSFFWYELMTSYIDVARDFYAGVVGWHPEPWPANDMSGRPYIVMNSAERGVAGIMNLPDGARGMPPAWVGYIYSADTDASANALKKAGGMVHRGPANIPDVGRFAVVSDPQGAMFMFLKPEGPDQPEIPMDTQGHIGWHDLYTDDWQAAFDFYSDQFGWTRDEAMDMGPMGTYQIFAVDGVPVGGMMNKSDKSAPNGWLFYTNVPDIDAAVKKTRDRGGKTLMEPMEVPGGQWVAQCLDPQGARFAMVAPGRAGA